MKRDRKLVEGWIAQEAPEDVRQALARLLGKRTPGPAGAFKPQTGTKAKRDEIESAARKEMHDRVWAWNQAYSGGLCDCGCGYRFRHSKEGELDHWIELSQGGPSTRDNGWRLRSECHEDKTNNRPDRTEWNVRRRVYCARAGIRFVERRVKEATP